MEAQDSDSSGTSATCVSSTIGLERVEGATAWLRANGKKGILGEFAGGNNDVCKDAVTGMLQHMKANNDVWMGALWWGGGPWWGDYVGLHVPVHSVTNMCPDLRLRAAQQHRLQFLPVPAGEPHVDIAHCTYCIYVDSSAITGTYYMSTDNEQGFGQHQIGRTTPQTPETSLWAWSR